MTAAAKYMLTALTLCYLLPLCVSGQNELSERDRKFVETLNQELGLSASQMLAVDSIYLKAARALDQLDKEIRILSRSDANEKEISMRVAVKSEEKRDIKTERDDAIQHLLSSDQLSIYREKIKPAKPEVMHFGIHNRADCKVCME